MKLTEDELMQLSNNIIYSIEPKKTADQLRRLIPIILDNQEKTEKWDQLQQDCDTGQINQRIAESHAIVERVKEYKAQLELLLRLNDKVEDTSKLTIVGLAAVRDTINGLQKCMVGKK